MDQTPEVENIFLDKRRGITYRIMAYRELNMPEMLHVIMAYNRNNTYSEPGSQVTIVTTIGYNGAGDFIKIEPPSPPKQQP